MERNITKKKTNLCTCSHHHGVGFGARLRAPEADRLYRLYLVHSRSSLDINCDVH